MKKYWQRLNAQQKITIMETLLSILEFSSSYNSYSNLRQRMQNIPTDRPPINLLRQEMAGTCVYLEVLQRTTSELEISKENNAALIDSPDSNTTPTNSDLSIVGYSSEENKLDHVAEEKLENPFSAKFDGSYRPRDLLGYAFSDHKSLYLVICMILLQNLQNGTWRSSTLVS